MAAGNLVILPPPQGPEDGAVCAVQVGLIAANDSIVLESCIYRILQKHFRTSPAYPQLLELFHEVHFLTVSLALSCLGHLGLHLDMLLSRSNPLDDPPPPPPGTCTRF